MIKGKLRTLAILLVIGLLGVWCYKDSPRKIEFLGYYERIDAHRVNTLENWPQVFQISMP